MIQIYDKNTTDFSRNGRVLDSTLSCYISEQLNGAYELELEHPLDNRLKWQEIKEGNIIKADGQLFRIYHKQKTLKGIKANARHIFYDLYDNFLEDVRPENQSGIGALDWILTHTQYPHPFTCTGDVGGSNTRYFVRKNVVEAIMGQDGILETWGGEIERDNFLIRYKQARGMDRGVHVRYGKNIIGIEETNNIDTVCTRMMPIGKDGLLLPEKYIDSPYINNYPHPKIRVYEFNDCETVEQLRATAQEFMEKNKIDIPPVNYKVDFLELSKTEEYKNYQVLERVYLGDTVTIKHSKLNIDLKCKVIKIKKNILTDKIEEVELGNFRNTLVNSLSIISNNINQLKEIQLQDKTFLQNAIDSATQLLTSALGGYVVKRENELLIMDTPDPNTAQKVWRWNLNGLGYSSTGINGPYGLAMTMDGRIVADFITTGTMTADRIQGGTLTLGGANNGKGQQYIYDANGNVIIALGADGIIAKDTAIRITKDLTQAYPAPSWDQQNRLNLYSDKITADSINGDATIMKSFNISGDNIEVYADYMADIQEGVKFYIGKSDVTAEAQNRDTIFKYSGNIRFKSNGIGVETGKFYIGDFEVTTLNDFSASMNETGYQKLPSGLILQWGITSITFTSSTYGSITYPIAFPNRPLFVIANSCSRSNNDNIHDRIAPRWNASLKTYFNYTAINTYDSSSHTITINWFAVGH